MKNFAKKSVLAIVLLVIILSACTRPAEPEITQPLIQGSFPFTFSAEDLHGNTITDASLGEKDLFFVYFWTTWCPACVNSMPGLNELAEEFADDIGFITLLGDFDTARETAIRITQDAPFYTVNANDSDFEQLMQLVQSGFLPTSVIIDTNGNVIGEQIVGGGTARFREAIEYALSR